MRQQRDHSQSGFTLLELLVVLVLVAFITTLLIQGMGYVAKVNDTFAREGDGRQTKELVYGWFDDVLSQLAAPALGDPSGRFRGDRLSFEGVTLSSVDRREGIPIPFAFRLEPTDKAAELIYVRRIEARRWPLLLMASDAHFQYQDALGQWHEEWPPSSADADALPTAVAMTAAEGHEFLMSTVQVPRQQVIFDDH